MFKKILILCLFNFLIFNNSYAENDENLVALIDTGQDLCRVLHKSNCATNKNLLFRGSLPTFSRNKPGTIDDFRQDILTAINQFSSNHQTSTPLPKTMNDLKQYRILTITLLYGDAKFFPEEHPMLMNEFKMSGNIQNSLPIANTIYGLSNQFNENQIALIWTPIPLSYPSFSQAYLKKNLNDHNYYALANLDYLIEKIQSLLTTDPTDKHPLLIYFHCVAGKDRTGAAAISYYMKVGGYSPSQNKDQTLRMPATNYSLALSATSAIGNMPSIRARYLAVNYCQRFKDKQDCRSSWTDNISFLWQILWERESVSNHL